MKYILVYFIFFLSTSKLYADSIQVVSMFEKDALVTHRLLSFKVKNSSNSDLQIKNVNVNNSCQAMIDFYYGNIFHILCTKETVVEGSVFLSSGELVSLTPFAVRTLGKSFSLPAGQNWDSATEPSVALGRSIYSNNCISCHRTEIIPKGQTELSVKNALSTEPMKAAGLDTKFGGDKQSLGSLVLYINEEL